MTVTTRKLYAVMDYGKRTKAEVWHGNIINYSKGLAYTPEI